MTRARPDTFVLLAPVSWSLDNAETLTQIHAETWQEEATYQFGDTPSPEEGEALDITAAKNDIEATGTIAFEDATTIPILVEDEMERLEDAVGTGKEPFQASAIALLRQHSAVWRIVVDSDSEAGTERALRAGRIMGTLAHAGAASVFLPAIVEMHSPSFIKGTGPRAVVGQSLRGGLGRGRLDGDSRIDVFRISRARDARRRGAECRVLSSDGYGVRDDRPGGAVSHGEPARHRTGVFRDRGGATRPRGRTGSNLRNVRRADARTVLSDAVGGEDGLVKSVSKPLAPRARPAESWSQHDRMLSESPASPLAWSPKWRNILKRALMAERHVES